MECLASGLRESGLRRGDRVGIYIEASVEQVLSIFAVSEAGGVFVPIAQLFPDQVAYIVRDCGMKALITKASKLSMLVALLSQIPSLEFIVLAETKAHRRFCSISRFRVERSF